MKQKVYKLTNEDRVALINFYGFIVDRISEGELDDAMEDFDGLTLHELARKARKAIVKLAGE